MNPDDLTRLWDMLEYSRAAARIVTGRTFDDYMREEMVRFSVERVVQVVGEAAWKLSKEFKSSDPETPWGLIEGQRHRLVHDYPIIEPERIWNVATIHIPVLIPQIEQILAQHPPRSHPPHREPGRG
jgi:uncharacterized protein with HEPN domain